MQCDRVFRLCTGRPENTDICWVAGLVNLTLIWIKPRSHAFYEMHGSSFSRFSSRVGACGYSLHKRRLSFFPVWGPLCSVEIDWNNFYCHHYWLRKDTIGGGNSRSFSPLYLALDADDTCSPQHQLRNHSSLTDVYWIKDFCHCHQDSELKPQLKKLNFLSIMTPTYFIAGFDKTMIGQLGLDDYLRRIVSRLSHEAFDRLSSRQVWTKDRSLCCPQFTYILRYPSRAS